MGSYNLRLEPCPNVAWRFQWENDRSIVDFPASHGHYGLAPGPPQPINLDNFWILLVGQPPFLLLEPPCFADIHAG
jgi:hypothetical protein